MSESPFVCTSKFAVIISCYYFCFQGPEGEAGAVGAPGRPGADVSRHVTSIVHFCKLNHSTINLCSSMNKVVFSGLLFLIVCLKPLIF